MTKHWSYMRRVWQFQTLSGNEGIRESHVDVNYDIAAENSSIISQGNQAQRIDEIEVKRPSIEPSYPSGQVIEEPSIIEHQKAPDSIY